MNSKAQIVPCKSFIPARSRTHPMWSAKKPCQGANHAEPFDPFELYRRLEKISNEQARAHERRLAKAEKHKTPHEYRHVPRYAAADFVNTASRNCYENQNVHPLARLVGRVSKPAESQLPTDGPMSHYVEQQDRNLQKMKTAAERNQFQRSQILQTAAESDESRDIYKPPQRDFESFFTSKQTREGFGDGIKSPLAADLETAEDGTNIPIVPRPIIYKPDDRHDWAQRDEIEAPSRRGFRDHILPVLRKTHLIGSSKNQTDDSIRERRQLQRRSGMLSFSMSR